MSDRLDNIAALFSGEFLIAPELLKQQLDKVKAYLFDWDGVFNDGYKQADGSSGFSEIDAMGTNLLRFSHFLHTGVCPVILIITGEHNRSAFSLAQREHFHAVYFQVRHKEQALLHCCQQYGFRADEVAFVYDDVLDLSIARQAGLRVMVPHGSNPLFREEVIRERWADYLTGGEGFQHAVRETTELLIGLRGNYAATIKNRMDFAEPYRQYLALRQAVPTQFFTAGETGIQQATPQ